MINSKKKILVCGGAGYIGSHVTHYLTSNGFSVVIIDDLSSGHIQSIPKDVNFFNISIGNKKELSSIFKKFEIETVIHLCANAYVDESVQNPLKYYKNNLSFGINLLETMIDNNVLKIIFSSSCTVYGNPKRIPVDEESGISPISPYGHTKSMFEQILKDFDNSYGLKYCTLRYFNAAGASDIVGIGEDHDPETHLIPLILQQALNKEFPNLFKCQKQYLRIFGNDYNTHDGTCIRDYIHVKDIAYAHKLALEYINKVKKSQIFNLSNNIGFSVMEIIKNCEKITGHKIPFKISNRRKGDTAILIGNSDKARKILQWKPLNSDIKTIIQTAWNWKKKFPNGYN